MSVASVQHALPTETSPPRPGLLLPALSLCRRELVRFVRQRNRVIGALATPVVFWLLIGAGMGRSFVDPAQGGGAAGRGYMEYFFPGTVAMILLFTAIFSTISIIEDRREGFLQGVLVAPVSRMAIVLGKVLGGTILAVGQGVLFLILAPFVGIKLSLAGIGLTLVVMVVLAFALTALGFCLAWRMSSTQGFHAIMNLFLMPMWLLSGALFPVSGAMGGIGWVMRLNPLTYGLAALRWAMYWGEDVMSASLPRFGVSFGVTMVFAIMMFVLASLVARRHTTADLQ
ncbi:MAG: ABC transporter permease [Tepidisphaeraceae bacterium]